MGNCMIKNSFIFLEKVSTTKEKNVWGQGITDWQDFIKTKKIKRISPQKKQYYNRKIQEAQHALSEDDSSYFINKLPKKEMWRLYDYFKDECCFLDIEVDSYGKMVLIGISNYFSSNFFVKGVNLDKKNIEKELSKYKLMVTFNGHSFDIPKIQKQMGIKMQIPHIDLKPHCVTLGFSGGLKEVEKILNLKRPSHLYGNPVDLWKAFHASGDKEYLDLLIEYNKEDCENLKSIMDHVYKIYKIAISSLRQNV
ncbi:hypothetical protein COV17_01085 [Candidatus Woesearchaeota archaeon CG10_big_fil_rev_8_21_14_0_10_36_11]|nr:MAG: hypothetical protein COV17_01085 [Candidatus Woesearchaeota archaeon CG10_big_fil_rev_8_21_14_0_10_36_11]